MSKSLIITEKEKIAYDIASAIGKVIKKEGHFVVDNQYFVTWTTGHLVHLSVSKSYDHNRCGQETLPLVPSSFKLSPNHKILKQLDVIKKLSCLCVEIICATDTGHEGELIFRYIYHFLNLKIPIKRLWTSSYTDKDIKEGMKNLKDGNQYEQLYLSAKCRDEADWIVSVNLTNTFTKRINNEEKFSIGRLQTPVLSMIVKRELEIKNFITQKYWQFSAIAHEMDGKPILPFPLKNLKKITEEYIADSMSINLYEQPYLLIKSVENTMKYTPPPLLFNLTSLQIEANRKWGFTANDTLKIAQSLYENYKVITYPKTNSCYITEEVYKKITILIDNFHSIIIDTNFKNAINYVAPILSKQTVNDKKATNNHAIIPTENAFKVSLHGKELQIFNLILERFLEAFADNCVQSITILLLEHGFYTNEIMTINKGWKGLFQDREKKEETFLPYGIKKAKIIGFKEVKKIHKNTEPPQQYTESTLLSDMENVGKDLIKNNEQENSYGLGPTQYRSGIIEKLLQSDYIIRSENNLIATEKGLFVYDKIKDLIISKPEITAKWELELDKMAKSNGVLPNKFIASIIAYTNDQMEKIKSMDITVKSEFIGICPKCKKGKIFQQRNIFCKSCDFKLYPSTFNYQFTTEELNKLLKGEIINVTGIQKKMGKDKAFLEMNSGKYQVSFIKNDSFGNLCPKCKSNIYHTQKAIRCESKACDFMIFKSFSGTKLSPENIDALLQGKSTPLLNLTTSSGNIYQAKLKLDEYFKLKWEL